MPGVILQANCPCGFSKRVTPGFSDVTWKGIAVFACAHCRTLTNRETPADENGNGQKEKACPRCGKDGFYLEDAASCHPETLRPQLAGNVPWLAPLELRERILFTCPRCQEPTMELMDSGDWD